MKKALSMLLAAAMLCGLCSCGEYKSGPNGEVGQRMTTAFLDFVVESAEVVNNFGGISPQTGKFVDLVIRVSNTLDGPLPLGNSDFVAIWGPEDSDYVYGAESLIGVDGIMPEKFYLQKDESCTYHVVFEIPTGVFEFSLLFVEYYSNGSNGDGYYVKIQLAA